MKTQIKRSTLTHIAAQWELKEPAVVRWWTHSACTPKVNNSFWEICYYLVFPFNDSLKQTLFGAIERKAARQEDEEDDPTSPHIHRFAIWLPLDHLWGHEVGSTNTTWRQQTGRQVKEWLVLKLNGSMLEI